MDAITLVHGTRLLWLSTYKTVFRYMLTTTSPGENQQIESGGMADKLFECFCGIMNSPFRDRGWLFIIEGLEHIERALGGGRYAM